MRIAIESMRRITLLALVVGVTAPGGAAGVNARERIGKGPWKNARGEVVARSVDDLHSAHMKSWNSSHGSRGCSPEGLKASGGAGLFYCFVAN